MTSSSTTPAPHSTTSTVAAVALAPRSVVAPLSAAAGAGVRGKAVAGQEQVKNLLCFAIFVDDLH